MKPEHTIQKLLEKKKRVEKDIEKVQKECNHTSKNVKFVFLNPDSQQTSIRWVCDVCQKTLHIPTELEIKKFISK